MKFKRLRYNLELLVYNKFFVNKVVHALCTQLLYIMMLRLITIRITNKILDADV